MASPDPGMDVSLLIWSTLVAGFALVAAGVPLSSFALFGLLADVTERSGVPWWVGGAVAGAATALGHGASYLFFAHLGRPVLSFLAARVPQLVVPVDRLRLVLAHDWAWATLLFLRWVGFGYAQVFWALAMAAIRRPVLLGLLLINDFLWALVWTYAVAGLLEAVPGTAEWVTPGAALLLVLSLVGGAWGVYRHLRRTARRS